jgi:uncharacterized protein YneF (UPF0154 family)
VVGLIVIGFVARKYIKKYIKETTPEEAEKEKENLITNPEESGIEEI